MKKDSFHGKLHFYLAVVVMLTYPFSIKVSSVMIGIWAFHWLVMLLQRRLEKPKWLWLLIMVSYPLMYVFSLTYSCNLDYGIFSIEKRISLFLIPVVISTVPFWNKEAKDRFFLFSYFGALAAAIICVGVAAYDFVVQGVNHFYWTALTRPLAFHPGYFSFYISILLFWFMNFVRNAWANRSRYFLVLAVLSIIFLSVFLILLSSKLQLFLFFMAVFALAFYQSKDLGLKFRIGLLLFLLASAYLVSTTYIRDRIRNISSMTYQLNDPPEHFNELTIRMALMECSWEVCRSNLFLGVGAGDSYDALEKVYRKYDYQFGYGDHQDPHNEYLNTMVGTGLLGLVLLLGTFGLSMHLAWDRKDLIHFLFILFFAISCMFESMLSQQKGIVLFSILNSIFVFHGTRSTNGRWPEVLAGNSRTTDI